MGGSYIATKILFVATVVLVGAVFGLVKGDDDDDGLCGMSQAELYECKPAVATGTATPPPPTAACCSALTHADLTCFCNFKNNVYLPFLGINSTRAMQLPAKCDPKQTAHC